ncbi:MAG: alpha/beta hydrolase [Bariatricus sp.]
MEKKWKKWLTGMLALCMILSLWCFPAAAALTKKVTPDTTMEELSQMDAFQKNDIGPHNVDWINSLRKNDTVSKVAGEAAAQDTADALNKLADNYESGVTVRYKIYSNEEVEKDPTLANVDLYYYPAKTKNQKFVLVIPGGGYLFLSQLTEGFDVANQFNNLGYNAFVLKYRTGVENVKGDAPLKDTARAVQFILSHCNELGIDPENYAVCGFSAGGHIASSFGTDEMGYKNYNLPKPGLLILGYPLICTEKIDKVFADMLEGEILSQEAASKYCVEKHITADYPRTYEFDGKDDYLLDYQQQLMAMDAALNAKNVPHKTVVYESVEHGSAAGQGQDSEGWIPQAVSYWEQNGK